MRHLNAAFYHFGPIGNCEALRQQLMAKLPSDSIKGTIILAPEGVNGFLAGPEAEIREAVKLVRELTGFTELYAKESYSDFVPFSELCIKLKPEIVTFRVPETTPPPPTTEYIEPAELARWFDTKTDFLILDTRNEYEVRLGRFAHAQSLGIQHFVDFAEGARQLPEDWKQKPVVTYCTGGIRCEKAAPFLHSLGFENVLQLKDGILGYFASQGGKHWEGECFVFDQRIALDPSLMPSGARLCEKCQGPIPLKQSLCPHCGAP